MQAMKKWLILLPVLLLAACGRGVSPEILFQEGTGCVPYVCDGPFAGDTIGIYYHIPAGRDIATMPVQVIIAGMNRNADRYRDDWIAKADQYGFLLIAPDLDEEHFPERVYQLGNVQDEDGAFNAPEDRVYPLIDKIFQFFLEHSCSRAEGFNIYGHSAGGQFVHRFALLHDSPYARRMVAANAGWYTFPSDTASYPYGIAEVGPRDGIDPAVYYGRQLILLLGDADTLRTESLRQTPEADAQGLTRLARGQRFFSWCRRDASRRGAAFNWQMRLVGGVGHSNPKMGPAAADVLYGGAQE